MTKKQVKKSASESIIMRFARKHGLTIVRWQDFCDCGRAAVVNDGEYYAGTLAADLCTRQAYWVD